MCTATCIKQREYPCGTADCQQTGLHTAYRIHILKRPVAEESSPTFTRSTRRISFSGKKNVKEFMPGDGGATIWITSYEESAEIVSTKSGKENLYGGLQATPEAIMKLRNNKIISKIPQKATDKAKHCKGVKNVPPEKNSYDDREQFSRNLQESLDISLYANEIQRLKINIGEERLPLRPLIQHSDHNEAAEIYISPQTSLNCPSPASIYCSFALSKKEIGKLRKRYNGKQLDITLADIITESDKNANNQISNLTAVDMVNETNIPSVQDMGNTCKAKREREGEFNLESMELVSSKKSPNKRSTTYYFDDLKLSVKNDKKKQVSLSRLAQLEKSYEFQEKDISLDDCDKENRNVCIENTDMELSFASIIDQINLNPHKNADRRDSSTNDLDNDKNNFQILCGAKQFAFSIQENIPIEDEVNKENRGCIDMEDFMDLSETVYNTNQFTLQHGDGKNEEQNLTLEEERNLDRMDMSLSPGANRCSMNLSVSFEKPSRNQQTIHSSYGLSLTVPKETVASNKKKNLVECTKLDDTVMKEDQGNEGMDIILSTINDRRDLKSHLPGNISNDNIHSKGRRTINIPCNVDLTLQEDTLHVNEETMCTNASNRKLFYDKTQCSHRSTAIKSTCDLDLTLQDEVQSTSAEIVTHNKLEKVLNSDSVAIKFVEERHSVRNTFDFDLENDSLVLSKNVENKSEDILQRHSTNNIRTTKERRSNYNICDLDLDFTMEHTVRNIAKGTNLKLDENGGSAIVERILADKGMPKDNVKENVIFAVKRQTIYDPCDLDISLQYQPICSNVTKDVISDNRLPEDCMTLVTDTNIMKCNSKNNAGNNMSSLIKRQTIYSPVNLDLTIQNDLTGNKNDAQSCPEMSNEESIDMSSKKHNIHYSVDSIHPTEAAYKDRGNDKKEQHLNSGEQIELSSCFSMKAQETDGASKREDYNTQPHDTLHKLERLENKAKNNLTDESISKNFNTEGNVRPSLQDLKKREVNNSSVQIVDPAIEESVLTNKPTNRTELDSNNLKSTGWNMGTNSFSGSDQLEQTSAIIWDVSQEMSLNSTMGLEIIDNRGVQNVEEIPRFGRSSRASSCQTNMSCNFSAVNTTEALCNIDFDKITRKGYKANLKVTPSFSNSTNTNKFTDTLSNNSNQCIHPPFEADDIEKINLSISNLNLSTASKAVNLKKDIPENKLKSQRTLTVKNVNEEQQSFCSRCKECDCKPTSEQNESEVSAFCWKTETPPPPREVDFSEYERFQNLPTIRELLDLHRRRRESINFESYEESVCNPIVPSLDDLLENYSKQFKLKVEKELPIGAIFPLIPSLDILINNKLQSEQFGWRLNTFCIPSGVMEFCNDKIRSVTLILKYSPNSFYSNEGKVMFEKVWLKISKLYGNSSPLDRIIENEIFLKTPYDLINYCTCFNNLFSFLSFMNNICEQAMQKGREFYKTVVHFDCSVEKDNSDVCFMKKTVQYAPNKKNVFLITQDFLVRVKNIETISYTDILFPPLSDFKESISSLPEGLEFLTKFFPDPVSYLKAKP